MAITEQLIQSALKDIIDPNTGKDYVTGKEARNIKIDGDNVSLDRSAHLNNFTNLRFETLIGA